MYSIDGKRMSSQKIVLSRDINTYQIAKPMQKGLYLLNIISNGGKLYHGKVMVL
jgi:hypothetical protein